LLQDFSKDALGLILRANSSFAQFNPLLNSLPAASFVMCDKIMDYNTGKLGNKLLIFLGK
jgi:hypothetical protein